MRGKITPKREKFIQEYIKTGSQTEAALASFNTTSRPSAAVMGTRVIQVPAVRERINKLIEEQEGGKDVEIVSRIIQRAKRDDSLGQKADECLLKLKGVMEAKEYKELDLY